MFKSYLIPWGSQPAADFNAAALKQNHISVNEILAIVDHWCHEQAELDAKLHREMGYCTTIQTSRHAVGIFLVTALDVVIEDFKKNSNENLQEFWEFLSEEWGRFPISHSDFTKLYEEYQEERTEEDIINIVFKGDTRHGLGDDHVFKHKRGWDKTIVPANAISPYNKCKLLYALVELGALLKPQMEKTYDVLDGSKAERVAVEGIKNYNSIVRHLGAHFFEFSESQITRLQNILLADENLDTKAIKKAIEERIDRIPVRTRVSPPFRSPSSPAGGNHV